ncbi:MAG: ATP-binding protein [Mycobacterium sp.]|nr:ATP-binding protein [Mycobacterium sp.]
MTVRSGSATPSVAQGEDQGRTFRLPLTRDRFVEIATAARREQHTYLGFLAELVVTECEGRDRRRTQQLIAAAGLPNRKRLEDLSFDPDSATDVAVRGRLADCDWVSAGSALCVVGAPGTGKTHLLTGLGIRAAEAGHRVRYAQARTLVAELAEAAEGDQRAGVIAHYGDVDLLLIDDLDRLRLDHRGAELLLAVLTARDEPCAVASAAERPLSALPKTFTDPRLCAAIVERLTRDGHVIDTGSRPYRGSLR